MKNKIVVEALDTYEKNNIKDSELNRIPKKGEIFSVSKERLHVLLGNNPFKKTFVKLSKTKTVEIPKEYKKDYKNKTKKVLNK